MTNTGEDCHTH